MTTHLYIYVALGSINFIDYKGRRLQIKREKLSEGSSNVDEPFKAFLPQTEIIEIRYENLFCYVIGLTH